MDVYTHMCHLFLDRLIKKERKQGTYRSRNLKWHIVCVTQFLIFFSYSSRNQVLWVAAGKRKENSETVCPVCGSARSAPLRVPATQESISYYFIIYWATINL